jgi:hypothetical protein
MSDDDFRKPCTNCKTGTMVAYSMTEFNVYWHCYSCNHSEREQVLGDI